jgi:hypothetical protein
VDHVPDKRLKRVDEKQKIGPGMEWTDNLDYVLARTDFFADYESPHYLALDAEHPEELTLVASKIKYRWLYRLPYWGGVVLIHSNGRVEDLSAEEARTDDRLSGQWIYPISLARRYVELQDYAAGWGPLTRFVRVPGRLEVEDLPGHNQFPFLTRGTEGTTYLVTATRGVGSAKGLFRMYFVGADGRSRFFHQFGTHSVAYGPRAALARMTTIPGYQWNTAEGIGTTIAVEPVYIVRPNDPALYWKFTLTNVDFSGISATAVAKAARPDDIRVFTRRDDFERWLRGEEPHPPVPEVVAREQLVRKIEDIVSQLNELKAATQTLR